MPTTASGGCTSGTSSRTASARAGRGAASASRRTPRRTGRPRAWTWSGDDARVRTDPSGNIVNFSYQPNGVDRENPRMRPLAAASDSLGLVEARSYDAAGRLVERRNGANEATSFTLGAGHARERAEPRRHAQLLAVRSARPRRAHRRLRADRGAQLRRGGQPAARLGRPHAGRRRHRAAGLRRGPQPRGAHAPALGRRRRAGRSSSTTAATASARACCAAATTTNSPTTPSVASPSSASA